MALTADAIHNWTEASIQRKYAALPEEVKAAAHAAMIRHHHKGTDAQVEADILNERYHLT